MPVKAGLAIPGWSGYNYTTSKAVVKRRNRIESVVTGADFSLFGNFSKTRGFNWR